MKNILIKLSYDGSKFNGFAKQPTKGTVQNFLEEHLTNLFCETIKVVASGRTDKNVHALSQYINFKINKLENNINLENIKDYLSAKSKYIKILNVMEVEENFSARYNVLQKTYMYKIKLNPNVNDLFLQDYQLNYDNEINMNELIDNTKIFIGKHNFESFTARDERTSYIREITTIKVVEQKNYVFLYITGTGFLRYMVRNIVGCLLAVNESKITKEDLIQYLENPLRGKSHFKARACGLYLYKVKY